MPGGTIPAKQAETGDRDPSGRFRKGQSGNPKGRPPGARALTTLLREALARDDGAAARWIIARLVLQSTEGGMEATKLIFDRTEGKVALPIVGDEDAPIPFTLQFGDGPAKSPRDMTNAELETAQEALGDDSDGA